MELPGLIRIDQDGYDVRPAPKPIIAVPREARYGAKRSIARIGLRRDMPRSLSVPSPDVVRDRPVRTRPSVFRTQTFYRYIEDVARIPGSREMMSSRAAPIAFATGSHEGSSAKKGRGRSVLRTGGHGREEWPCRGKRLLVSVLMSNAMLSQALRR